jgi:protein-disulfide isomerase
MDRRTLIMGAGAGFVVIGGVLVYRNMSGGGQPVAAVQAGSLPMAADTSYGLIPDMVMGDPNAPVEVIEYASLTCPHCARFHSVVLPQIKENYIDTGRVRFVHREAIFDRPGLWATLVARCAGDDRYFGLLDLIYRGQAEWTQGSMADVSDNLRQIGLIAGMSGDQLDACLQDADTAQAIIDTYERQSEAHDVTATPTFVIDGERYSNMSYADFSAILDGRLAQVGAN